MLAHDRARCRWGHDGRVRRKGLPRHRGTRSRFGDGRSGPGPRQFGTWSWNETEVPEEMMWKQATAVSHGAESPKFAALMNVNQKTRREKE